MKVISRRLCIKTIASLILVSIIIGTAGHADESHLNEDRVIKGLGDLGTVSFATSCKADAQKAINTGVGLLHHMMYAQAEVLFSHWIKKEPECAMLHWGYSMSLYHPLWAGVIKEEALIQGLSALTKAQELTSTKREQSYINAASQYFQDWRNTSDKDRTTNWANAQALVYQQNPDDIDAAAFSALSQLAVAPKNDPLFTKNKEAGALLAKFREASPMHPGVIHYTIHAYDNPPLAELAIDAARAYGNIAPEVPHALHMPSHIFIRLGMWSDAVNWDLRSAKAALKYPVGGKTSHHYTHALDYLIYAYLQQGEGDKAKQAFEQAETHHPILPIYPTAYAFSAIPARIALEQQKWQQASQIKVQHPSYIPWQKFPQLEAITYYARGLGAARSGDLKLAQQSVEVLNDLHDKTKAISPAYWAVLVDAQRMAVKAWISFGKGQKEQALTQLRQAADLEDSKDKNPVTPGAVLPARELLADMLLLSGDYAGAQTAYEAVLAISPNRLNSVAGLKEVLSKVSVKETESGEAPLKRFVVVLDNVSGDILSASQVAAAKSDSTDTPESTFAVSLQEEFQSKEVSYEILTAQDEGKISKYLSALNLTPISVIETEFTNGPFVGGGETVNKTPKDNHEIYIIERGVPGISGLPLEKQKEISKGSQSVVAQFGDSLEWDRSYLTQEGTFCVYRTDDEKNIKEHAKIAGFPADKISSVKHVVHKFEF